MRNKNTLLQNIFYIAILSTVVVATWIASALFYSITNPTVSEDTSMHSEPITPAFDTKTLDEIGSRIAVPIDLSETVNYIDPIDSTLPESSESADLEIVPEPSISPIQNTDDEIQETEPIVQENQTQENIPEEPVIPDQSESL